jgi:hypothetical protein
MIKFDTMQIPRKKEKSRTFFKIMKNIFLYYVIFEIREVLRNASWHEMRLHFTSKLTPPPSHLNIYITFRSRKPKLRP